MRSQGWRAQGLAGQQGQFRKDLEGDERADPKMGEKAGAGGPGDGPGREIAGQKNLDNARTEEKNALEALRRGAGDGQEAQQQQNQAGQNDSDPLAGARHQHHGSQDSRMGT